MLSQFFVVGTLLSIQPPQSNGNSVIIVEVNITKYDSTLLDFTISKKIIDYIKDLKCINGVIGLKGVIKRNELVVEKLSILQEKDYI